MSGVDRWSIKRIARLGGFLSPFSGLPDGFSVAMLRRVFVQNNAAASAANLLAAETMFRLGMIAELYGLAIFVISGILLYAVFKPAGQHAALFFLVTTVIGATFQGLNVVADAAALLFVKGGPSLVALGTGQIQAMTMAALRMHSMTYTIALVFLGFASVSLAWLVLHSTFLPRFLGYLMVIDGLGFLVGGFLGLVFPVIAARAQPFVPFLTAAIGEFPLWLWLMVKGVDEERWKAQAAE
jgi:hypothetical protein